MASVRSDLYLQAKPAKSSGSIQRESSGSNQMPQSALRSGKYDTTNRKLNELKLDLSEIHDTYGYDASLYHVLSINKKASSREIKAAYLKKGREILLAGRTSAEPSSDISERSRKKFQAASLAYEILSKEDLRALYDGRYSVARKNSVQWSRVVQEKVIDDAHPDEHSHRKYPRRGPPPVYEDTCSGLDDEFDELMYYFGDFGSVKFVDLRELQGLVDSFNTSMKMKKEHLLESFDTKDETERQPSEEVATIDGGEQRQLPAQSEDNGVIEMQKGGTDNFVCDAAEETASLSKDNDKEGNDSELDKSTVATAVAATGVAATVLGVLANSDDKSDKIESTSTQEEAPRLDDPVNKMNDSDPEEKTTNNKSKRTMKLKTMAIRRKFPKSQQVANTADEEPATDVVSDEVAVATTDTGTCLFACGASEVFANDDDVIVEGNNKVVNSETSELATDDAEDAAMDTAKTAAAEKATIKRTMPSMKLRKAMTPRRKSKSQQDTEDMEPASEADPSAEAGAVAVAAGAGWYACCVASEVLQDNDHDGNEMVVNDMEDKKETQPEEGRDVSEEGSAVESEEATKSKTKPSMKLRKAMTPRRKSKSQQDTEDQEPASEVGPSAETGAVTVAAGAGWFACCVASEVLQDNDHDGNEMIVNDMEDKKETQPEEGRDVSEEGSAVESEEASKSKTKPSMKLLKAMASRRKSKSQQDTEDQDSLAEADTSAEAGAVAVGAGAGWFACCVASEVLQDNDVDGNEMILNNEEDKKETQPEEGRNVTEKGCGVESEEASKSKTKPSMKLRKAMTPRRKSKSQQDAEDQDSLAEADTSAEAGAVAVGAGAGWFACCVASEVLQDNDDDGDSDLTASNVSKTDVTTGELEEENSVDKVTDKRIEEKTSKSKTKPSMKLRKAMTSRRKSKSQQDAEDQEPASEADPSAEASSGWFACCGVSEALALNDASEVSSDMMTYENEEATIKTWGDDETISDEDCGGKPEKKEASSTASKKLLKTVSIRPKTKNRKDKPEKEEDEEDEEDEDEVEMHGLFLCCGASETLDNSEEINTAQDETKTPKRISSSARKLRDRLNIRKKVMKPLLDTDEDDEFDN